MKEPRKDMETRAFVTYASLRRALHALDNLMDHQCAAWGLSQCQFRVLEHLLESGPIATGELAESILFGDSTISVVTRNLARAGLLTRRTDENDKRKAIVQLTPKGRKLVEDMMPERAEYLRAKTCVLGKREEEYLIYLCQKLAAGDPIKFVLEISAAEREEEEKR